MNSFSEAFTGLEVPGLISPRSIPVILRLINPGNNYNNESLCIKHVYKLMVFQCGWYCCYGGDMLKNLQTSLSGDKLEVSAL